MVKSALSAIFLEGGHAVILAELFPGRHARGEKLRSEKSRSRVMDNEKAGGPHNVEGYREEAANLLPFLFLPKGKQPRLRCPNRRCGFACARQGWSRVPEFR